MALQQFQNVFYVLLLTPNIAGGDGVQQSQPIIVDSEPEWEFETIFQHWHRYDIQQYLIMYVGYDQSEAMWLDEADLVNAPDVVAEYRAHIG